MQWQNVRILYLRDQIPCADKYLMTYCWYILFYQCFAFEGGLSEVTHPHRDAGTEAA